MGSRESSFHVEGLVYQRSVRSDGMFKEQQEGQYYGQRKGAGGWWARKSGRQWTPYISCLIPSGKSHHFFSGKGFNVLCLLWTDQVGIHFNIYPKSPSNFWLLESSIWVSILFICWAFLGSPTGWIKFIPCHTALCKWLKQKDLYIVPVPGNRAR